MKIKAILLVGGSGVRFGSQTPKQFLNLSGKKVYLHTLETFLSFNEFEEIILACPSDWIEMVEAEVSDPRVRVIAGGPSRQASSYRALIACGKETDQVVIHDGARPLISRSIIQANLEALQKHRAVDTCIPSTDTIVVSKGGKSIDAIPKRSHYFRGQTPQSFTYPLILNAHEQTSRNDASDDCQLILEQGHPVHIVNGSEDNLKITTLQDLFLAEQLLRIRSKSHGVGEATLKDKIFAITGGTGGIGSAVAKALKEEGATPLIISRSAKEYRLDLTHPESSERLFERIHWEHGEIDGLINCVGALGIRPFHTLSTQEISDAITHNLHSILYSCRFAKVKKGGHIINLSSSSFSRGRKGYVLYSSAKAALVNFTQGLAEERPDLQINAVIPQRTDTPLRKANFPNEDPATLLSPQEVAAEILQLLKQENTTGGFFEVRKS